MNSSALNDNDEPQDDATNGKRWRRCEVCGQEYSTEDMDQVFHHGPEPHQPKRD